jgi:hypothetical protein
VADNTVREHRLQLLELDTSNGYRFTNAFASYKGWPSNRDHIILRKCGIILEILILECSAICQYWSWARDIMLISHVHLLAQRYGEANIILIFLSVLLVQKTYE